MKKIIYLIPLLVLCLTSCKTTETIKEEVKIDLKSNTNNPKYLSSSDAELKYYTCDSIIYRYVFVGCMESSKDGWGQDESACKSYAKSQACKQIER